MTQRWQHHIWTGIVVKDLRDMAAYELTAGDQDYLASFWNAGDGPSQAAADLLWIHGYRPNDTTGKWDKRAR